MSWIVALLAKLTTGWSLVDFSKGVIVNIFSSILTGGGGKLLSKLKGNKDDKELLLDCFEKAVKANVKNKDIAQYIAENDKEREVYIKITLGYENGQTICISFHIAEHPLNYPFK